jgi:C-terminal processing protease CtpA/Prc
MFQKIASACFFLLIISIMPVFVLAQNLSSYQRQVNSKMISIVKSTLMENYYDPTFHGVDLETKFKEIEQINKQAKSNGEVFVAIAALLMELNDSHTNFIPPTRVNTVEYGWEIKAFGEKCLISYVKPKSDAEKKGLKVGDEVLSLDGFKPSRQLLWQMDYLYRALNPRLKAKLTVLTPEGETKEIEIQSGIIKGKKNTDLTDYNEVAALEVKEEREAEQYAHKFSEYGKDLIIWKMPAFDLPQDKVDDVTNRISKFKNVIIDLRGNPGGAEITLLRLIGSFTDHDLKIGDLVRRKEKKELIAKTRGKENIYQGNLIILIDSESGSSSELFARTMQMEKRGTVIGDLSAGAVMRSKYFSKSVGLEMVTFFGLSVTDADLVMTDGKSLERTGVTPDILMIPSALDLKNKRDVVLSTAATRAGVTIEPEKAHALFNNEKK